MDDDVVEIPGLGQAALEVDFMRRTIQQLAAGHERGGLGQPGRVPIAGDLALGLVARAGAAVRGARPPGETGEPVGRWGIVWRAWFGFSAAVKWQNGAASLLPTLEGDP